MRSHQIWTCSNFCLRVNVNSFLSFCLAGGSRWELKKTLVRVHQLSALSFSFGPGCFPIIISCSCTSHAARCRCQNKCPFCIFSACHKLISPEEGQLPNAFVEIRTMTPPSTSWSKHAQTEIIEVSFVKCNKTFVCYNQWT